MIDNEYLDIRCSGAYLFINQIKYRKIYTTHTFDLIDFNESKKALLKALLKHWQDIPIRITYNDFKYLKSLKVL